MSSSEAKCDHKYKIHHNSTKAKVNADTKITGVLKWISSYFLLIVSHYVSFMHTIKLTAFLQDPKFFH